MVFEVASVQTIKKSLIYDQTKKNIKNIVNEFIQYETSAMMPKKVYGEK